MLVRTGKAIVQKLAVKTETPTFFSWDVLIEKVQSYLFRPLLFSSLSGFRFYTLAPAILDMSEQTSFHFDINIAGN